ncbi:MAG: DNA-binding protein [Thermoplasmata archaeon]|nr:DNA-binding protein [Thermoplasmata archaeon]
MRSAELRQGRTFVLRLEDGEVLHEAVESFCRDNGIVRATVSITGAVDKGSMMVSGPSVPIEGKIQPRIITLEEKCEITGRGTVFPDADGNPLVHIHGSVGREGFSATGDLRPRMVAWLVVEIVITELVGEGPVRLESDPRIDGKLLEIRRWHPRRSSGRRSTTRTASRSRSTGT